MNKPRARYAIESCLVDLPVWRPLPFYDNMPKGYADGAWRMLSDIYGHDCKHRLLKDGVVIDEIGKQEVTTN